MNLRIRRGWEVKLSPQDWVITDSGITNVPFAYITQEGNVI